MMEVGLFGLMALLGFVLFFEGFTKKNPFVAWAGAIMLMITGTEILLNGVLYPSGAIIYENSTNITTIAYTYVTRSDWFITAIGRLLFWVGFQVWQKAERNRLHRHLIIYHQ